MKNIRWNRPKNWQTVSKLHIPQRRQPRDPMVSYFEQFTNNRDAAIPEEVEAALADVWRIASGIQRRTRDMEQ